MGPILYEVAALTPYTTNLTFPLLGSNSDHEVVTYSDVKVQYFWQPDPEEPNTIYPTEMVIQDNRKEIPSCLSSVESISCFSVTSSSSMAPGDVTWENKELCSTKYLDEFEELHFDQLDPSSVDVGDLGEARLCSNYYNPSCDDVCKLLDNFFVGSGAEEASSKSVEFHEADMNVFGIDRFDEKKVADNATDIHMDTSCLVADVCLSVPSGKQADTDDGSSSAFSSCRESRSSSQWDLHELTKGSSDDLLCLEKPSCNEDHIFSKFKKPLEKSVTFKPTVTKYGHKLSLDLEFCQGYESGYCDSLSSSSVCSEKYEFSTLNPLSKPFMPKAWATLDDTSYSGDASDSHVKQCDFNSTPHFVDSGIDNTENYASFNQTKLNSTSVTSTQDDTLPVNQETLCPGMKVYTEMVPPYLCPLPHEQDFIPFLKISLTNLPESCRSDSTLKAIKSIGQRVVKLRVNKPVSLMQDESSKANFEESHLFKCGELDAPKYDNYGTGFVFKIDHDQVHVRTHRKIVGSAEEAAVTQIYFTVNTGQKVLNATCIGQKDGFVLVPHSECAELMCSTPLEILDHLYLFKDVPVSCRKSLFNDSSYYSDLSSGNSSLSDGENTNTERHLNDSLLATSELSPHNCLTYTGVIGSNQSKANFKPQETDQRPIAVPQTVLNNYAVVSTKNIYKLANLVDVAKTDTYQLAATNETFQCNQTSVCESPEMDNQPSDYQVPTPLMYYERKLEQGALDNCSFTGEIFGTNGQYNLFSSYAGDIFSSLCTKPDFDVWSAPWEYERLLYLQNNLCTQPFIRSTDLCSDKPFCHRNTYENTEADSGSVESSVTRFTGKTNWEELSSVDAYLSSWDRDLLNLDSNLNPLPAYDPLKTDDNAELPDIVFDSLVDEIVREEDNDEVSKDNQASAVSSCCRKSQLDSRENLCGSGKTYALIISYPHGGIKTLSVGQFSRHHHVGGELYDTPSCMGSCGAPVVALLDSNQELSVTQLIHCGTTVMNGISCGIGLTFF